MNIRRIVDYGHDWEIVFVDGKVVHEHHITDAEFWIEFIKKLGITVDEEEMDLLDVQSKDLM